MVNDLVVVGGILHLLGGLVLGSLVHQDATLRGSDRPLAPAVGALLLGLVGAVGYYLLRDRIGPLSPDADRTRAPTGPRLLDLLRSLLLVVAVFLTATAVAGLGAGGLVAAGVVTAGGLEYRVAASVLQFLGFGVAVAGYLAITDEWDLVEVRVPTLRHLGLIVGGLVVLVVAQVVMARLLTVLEVQAAQNQVVATGQQNPRYFLYMIPVAVLLVGPFEELVFRGGVQGILRRTWGPGVAIVVASILFGSVHIFALLGGGGTGQLAYIAVAATLGLVLGYLYERTHNLVVPAVVHGLYNATLFAVQYASATGLA
ncbi:CPBP family intramembrane glutamic endopeptidase [Haloplanus salilacus]|uniref:CPBP family intramembrane glutamic endopeptidase n=1 Tax=Haloplanus salilacus TaxID=2949994 RepID=UPI0030D59B44